MIAYESHTLDNGLKVFIHEDHSTKSAVLNILYNVGSRDESPEKTGFAHLFEHLMFGGSKNIASYDEPLQKVGGENNAFTSPDITNYYITLPSNNLETAFWLESDRMMELSFSEKALEVQRKVVIEEFKQRYLNQPYGDVWLKLRPLAYKVHPYQWATIGKDISHIETATMDDVRSFFYKFYRPSNAIMVVAGDVNPKHVMELAQKWFGSIPEGDAYQRNLPVEPPQTKARHLVITADVPSDMIYKAYNMPGRTHDGFYATDILSDILGRGKSSVLYQSLVKKHKLFNDIGAYTLNSADPGLLLISGKISAGHTLEEADSMLSSLVSEIGASVHEETMEKARNQAESSLLFSEVDLLNRAMTLAYCAFLGDPELVNKEAGLIQSVTQNDVLTAMKSVLRTDNCSTMYYRAQK
jgi:zinc protease